MSNDQNNKIYDITLRINNFQNKSILKVEETKLNIHTVTESKIDYKEKLKIIKSLFDNVKDELIAELDLVEKELSIIQAYNEKEINTLEDSTLKDISNLFNFQ